jgi:hypothetical protein
VAPDRRRRRLSGTATATARGDVSRAAARGGLFNARAAAGRFCAWRRRDKGAAATYCVGDDEGATTSDEGDDEGAATRATTAMARARLQKTFRRRRRVARPFARWRIYRDSPLVAVGVANRD